MLQGKRTRRIIAATLLTIMLTNTLAPTVTYALTSGPTAPEATSFEPVDTTDMVNLQTGDFTYNIPLLEVPGPEGGYPLSLAYHAGIQPNEDASWVGLGWTLNPGSITRSVNGYPDDWLSPANTSHTYWEGGVMKTYSVGVTVGIANTPANVSFGLSFSQDTYRGFGVGMSVGVGGALGPLSMGFTTGTTGYGDYFQNGSMKLGAGGPLGSLGLDLSTNFSSLEVGFNAKLGALGYSMSTSGARTWSYDIYSKSVSSTSDPALQTSTTTRGLNIPLGTFSISASYSKTRYWIDNSTSITTHGSLYGSGWEGSGGQVIDNVGYDTYSLLEDNEDKSMADYADPTTIQGGAYLDFDIYNVNAQGLGGSMRPYEFVGEALGQNRKDQNNNPKVTYFSPGSSYASPQFRFVGDFSNTYRQAYSDYSDVSLNLRSVAPPFDNNPIFGNDFNNDGIRDGFANNMLAGSRYIQIGAQVQPSNVAGYNKNERYKSGMIDGFSITNESGVTYHYGLPAYTWGEENYQKNMKSPQNSLWYNRGTKPDAYAYTWYLTSVTGPDFVDRDAQGSPGYGKANDGDWGYWINFEYGKWSNNYVWRNPATGYTTDEDNNFQNVSMGRKEIYYLNAIRTRTHVALFEKDIRYDGKGVSPSTFDKFSDGSYKNNGEFDVNSSQSLQLRKIYLLKSEDAGVVNYNSGNSEAYRPITARSIYCSDCELAANVLDKVDVETIGRTNVESKAIRVVDFASEYSLCRNTTNSFDINTSQNKLGKLTLNSLSIRGKGGVDLLPPTRFEYEVTNEERKYTGGATISYEKFTTTNGAFEVGDLIMKEGTPSLSGGVIRQKDESGGMYTYWLWGNALGDPVNANVYATKNPSYFSDQYDKWGMYKSNSVQNIGLNENQTRITSKISAQAIDAWSLRKIITSLGSEIKIKYESDSYSKSAMSADLPFAVTQNIYTPVPAGTVGFAIRYSELGGDKVGDFFKPGDKVDFIAIQTAFVRSGGVIANQYIQRVIDSRKFNNPVTVHSILESEYVFLQGEDLQYQLYTDKNNYYTDAGLLVANPQNYVIEPAPLSAGNLSVSNSRNVYGGGLRVKSLSIDNSMSGVTSSTTFDYNIPGTESSSGVTSYEGGGLDKAPFESPYTQAAYDITKKNYKKALYKNVNELYSLAREIPAPGVMYEYVTVENTVKNEAESLPRVVPGVTRYQFDVFRDNMIYRRDVTARRQGATSTRNLTLQKFTGSLGLLKRVTQFDKKNGKRLKETINHYLHDGLENMAAREFMDAYYNRLLQYKYQGLLQERYSEVKEVANQTNSADNGVKATLSAREEYPCINTGQTTIDYVSGIRASTNNVEFDFFSGMPTKIDETDAYGNRFRTETKPAYLIPAYGAMGLKMSGGKNMLSQTAGKYLYKMDGSNNVVGIVSAEVNTWANNTPVMDVDGNTVSEASVWRTKSSFKWMPDTKTNDGLTASGNFIDFNWNAPASSDARWKKATEVTLYDVYSNPLEVKDINNNYAAKRLDYGSKRPVFTGSPANYYEIAYSGAEDEGVNQTNNAFVKKADGIVSSGTAVAHTGTKSLKLGTGGKKGFLYTVSTDKLIQGRKYITSVWVKPVSGSTSDVKLYYTINGVEKGVPKSSASSTSKAGNWTLVNLIIDGSDIVPGATLTVGCKNDAGAVEAYVDDFRFQPFNAVGTAYVYDAFTGELTHVLNKNNLYTKYEYDAVGRLVQVYREKLGVGEFKTNEYQYNYGTRKYLNVPINRYISKTGCPVNSIAPPVLVNIPEGQYVSYVSPEDANAQAEAAAQDQANAQGSCIPVYATISTQFTSEPGIVDVVVNFWANAGLTIPYNVSPVFINYKFTATCEPAGCPGNYTTTKGNLVSGTSAVLSTETVSFPGNCDCWTTAILLPGSGYTIAE